MTAPRPVQAELFGTPIGRWLESPGADDVAIDVTFSRAQRTALDATSWVELVPGWMAGSEKVFHQLAHGVPWRQHHRYVFAQRFLEPRLTAEYRDLRNVSHSPLLAAAAALSAHYRVPYDSLWLNLYRGGGDSTGWHRDRFSCRRPECIVPVLTLGTPRRFLIKPRKGGPAVAFRPRSGDLVVMGGRCQQDWLHGVPKAVGVMGARISVNFQSSVQARHGA
jgi:alkylated DNA repair dioxygenase AlkB